MRFRIRNGCSTFARTLAFTRFLAFCNSSTKFLYWTLRLVHILRSRSRLPDGFSLSLISTVAPHLALLPVQQVRQHVLVRHRSRRRAHRMHMALLGVHSDVCFQPEVASRPRELPPQPLSDPYVTLSRHTAPASQPYPHLPASGETTAVRQPSSCAATAHCPAFVPIRPCTCVWPTVRALGQCAGKHGTWLSDRTLRSSSTTLG